MNIVVEEADPLAYTDDLLTLFARVGKPRSQEWFEWYYEDKGYGPPTSWILHQKGGRRVVGLVSVVRRRMRFRGRSLVTGLIGNMLLDPDARKGFGFRHIARVLRLVPRQQNLDLLLAINPNDAASKLARAYRYANLGTWRVCVHVHRSRQWLKAKLRWPGVVVSPVVDVAARMQRAFAGRPAANLHQLEVRQLGGRELDTLSPEDWLSNPDQITGEISSRLLQRQFVNYPGVSHEFFAQYLAGSGRPVGLVVTTTDALSRRALIRHVITDYGYLSEADAILAVVRSNADKWGICRLDIVEGSRVCDSLKRSGFLLPPLSKKTHTAPLMATWRRDHDLAADFARPESWTMFQGFNDV